VREAICAALALTTSRSVASSGNGSAPLEFDEAKIRIELNATAQDVGSPVGSVAGRFGRSNIRVPSNSPPGTRTDASHLRLSKCSLLLNISTAGEAESATGNRTSSP
jgi:hypothetical protein